MVKIYQQPFAHAGTKQAIPDASDPQGFVSNEDGFTTDYELPDTDPNYKPIERAEFNGLMNMVTEAVGELQQFGFAKWQPITWPQGARVVEGGVVYRALVQTSQQPPHADWKLEFGTAASRDVGESSGNVMEVGAGGWMGQGDASPTALGYPAYLEDPTNLTKTIRSNEDDNGVLSGASGIHFSCDNTWGRVRVSHYTPQAWVQGGLTNDGSGWTSEVLLSASLLATTGQSTSYPMTQKAVTDAINNSAIGVGQTWQDVTGSRVAGTTYTNTTGRPIQVSISIRTSSHGASSYSFLINGVTVASDSTSAHISDNTYCHVIPANGTYRIEASANTNLLIWTELR